MERDYTVSMANFHLDPLLYVPASHHTIDGGEDRVPRNFVMPHTPIVRRHEEFMLAEVMPIPQPDQIGAAREEVVQWLQAHSMLVRSVSHGFVLLVCLSSEMRLSGSHHFSFHLNRWVTIALFIL